MRRNAVYSLLAAGAGCRLRSARLPARRIWVHVRRVYSLPFLPRPLGPPCYKRSGWGCSPPLPGHPGHCTAPSPMSPCRASPGRRHRGCQDCSVPAAVLNYLLELRTLGVLRFMNSKSNGSARCTLWTHLNEPRATPFLAHWGTLGGLSEPTPCPIS